MDLAELKTKHPELYEQAIASGKAEAMKASEAVVAQARAEGAKAENERIQKIEKLNATGSEKVVNASKFDMTKDANSIAAEVLAHQEVQRKTVAAQVNADAEELADTSVDLNTGASVDDQKLEKAMVSAMVRGHESRHYAIKK